MSNLPAIDRGTALITGASAGIGEELATRFVEEGHDVVLVARSKDKLEQLAAAFREQGVAAHVEAADLTERDAPERLAARLDERGVAIRYLVNNAGYGSNGPFLNEPLDREVGMIDLNVTALVQLCHLFGNRMKSQGGGHILNIASTAGFQPGPYMATYYATKAFVVSFSEALAYELEHAGVYVTCHCPGATDTEFAEAAGNIKARLFQQGQVASAREVAEHAYGAMMQRKVLAVHGALNWLMMQSTRFGPRALTRAVAARVNLPPGESPG